MWPAGRPDMPDVKQFFNFKLLLKYNFEYTRLVLMFIFKTFYLHFFITMTMLLINLSLDNFGVKCNFIITVTVQTNL